MNECCNTPALVTPGKEMLKSPVQPFFLGLRRGLLAAPAYELSYCCLKLSEMIEQRVVVEGDL